MKKLVFIIILLLGVLAIAQPDTEVYVMDISTSMENFTISNFKNISNNKGYDSQPSFVNNEKILYAGTRNGNTEIQLHTLHLNATQQLNTSTSGGEYSPQQFPVSKRVAAVRLDTSGLQRLYAYDYIIPGTAPQLLLKDAEIAYYAFHDEDRIVASVLGGNQLNLVIANLKTGEINNYLENSGRSIHKVPQSTSICYTAYNEEKNADIYLLDIDEDGESFFVCQLPIGVEDYCWLSNSKLLAGSGSKLYLYDLFGKQEWVKIADLTNKKIKNITRLAVSPNGKKLAIVAEERLPNPAKIVDAQIGPFNEGNIEAFANAFSKDVVVRRFPSDTMYVGNNKLKENYARFFKKNKTFEVEVIKRIALGNYVIDEEIGAVNGKRFRQAVIYETKDGKISSMTFVENKTVKLNPETIINLQMKAYNARNIDAFIKTFSNDVALYSYPNKLTTSGKDEMKKRYGDFFKNNPDLNYTIPKRIVVGNIVIDKENIRANGKYYSIVAIYEVNEGKINKATFIR